MQMENEFRLPLARETVWEALNDPAVLQASIPGCESFEKADENSYDAVVNAKIGAVRARFKGRVTLEDLQPPESYSMRFQGQGGQAGFVKGSASVRLDAEDGGTRVSYSADASLGGKLAQLGNRLIKGAADKTAKEFFDNFAHHMGGGEEAAGSEAAAAEGGGTAPAGGSPGRRWPWVALGAGVVLVVLILALA